MHKQGGYVPIVSTLALPNQSSGRAPSRRSTHPLHQEGANGEQRAEGEEGEGKGAGSGGEGAGADGVEKMGRGEPRVPLTFRSIPVDRDFVVRSNRIETGS